MSARHSAAQVAPPTIRGWCPGALQPMASGDGLIVRIRIPGGRLDGAALRALADLGRRCGNGAFDLSQRANLQMRGVSERNLPEIHRALADLGYLARDIASEHVQNVIAPPLAGFDPAALIDGGALAGRLEARLRDDSRLHALPGKFGFVVDDGGMMSMADVDVDIALEAARIDGDVVIALRLAGAPDFAACVAQDAAVDAATRLALAFLDLCETYRARRMRRLVAARGADAVFAAAGLSRRMVARRPAAPLTAMLGAHAVGARAFLGCAAPFGRWSAGTLDRLADCARAQGADAFRFTPWRALLLPGVAPDRATALAAALGRENFIVDGADPRLAVAACPGAPACGSASVRTHESAQALVPLLAGAPPGVRLHVSGCAKGCARPRSAPFTLVGRAGLFDLVVDGPADGAPVAVALDLAAAHCEIARRMAEVAPT
jgi:precorrin-3B synthase